MAPQELTIQMQRVLRSLAARDGYVKDGAELHTFLEEAQARHACWQALIDRGLVTVKTQMMSLSGGRQVRIVEGYCLNRRAVA